MSHSEVTAKGAFWIRTVWDNSTDVFFCGRFEQNRIYIIYRLSIVKLVKICFIFKKLHIWSIC